MRGERAVHAHAVPEVVRPVRGRGRAALPRAARVRGARARRVVRRREAQGVHVPRLPDLVPGGGRAVPEGGGVAWTEVGRAPTRAAASGRAR